MYTTRKKIKMQGKTAAHADSVVRSQILELIRAERIKTTPRKARILKAAFDRLISQAKQESNHSKRTVSEYLRNERAEQKLYDQILSRLEQSDSGHTVSARTLPRKGDNAEQVIVMIKGTKLQAKRSRLQRALARREEQERQAAASAGSRVGKLKDTLTATVGRDDAAKKESKADTRRVST